MKFLFILLILISRVLAGTATDITGLYYTGGTGATDPNWKVTYANVNGVSGNSTYMGDAYVVTGQNIDPAWIQNTTVAQWITAPGAASNGSGANVNTGGDYLPGNGTAGSNSAYFIYTLNFTILGIGTIGSTITNNIQIGLTLAADDQYKVYVNPKTYSNGDIKVSQSTLAGSQTNAWNNTSVLSLKNYGGSPNAQFKIGNNVLSVLVDNTNSVVGTTSSTSLNPSGFLLYQQYNSTTIDGRVIPEPSTYGIIFIGICVLGAGVYRKIKK